MAQHPLVLQKKSRRLKAWIAVAAISGICAAASWFSPVTRSYVLPKNQETQEIYQVLKERLKI